jgi:hypothetical protein
MSRPKAKAKPRTVFAVQRKLDDDDEFGGVFGGDPERVFATRAAAEQYAADRTREARAYTNPFAGYGVQPAELCRGGMRAFKKVLAQLKLKPPDPDEDNDEESEWAAWWDRTVPTLTPAERDVLWGALTKYELYRVEETTLEG